MPLPPYLISDYDEQEIENFFRKIRQSLAEKPQVDEDSEAPVFVKKLTEEKKNEPEKDIPEEKLYAKIGNREFQVILRDYAIQQETSRRDEHVTCDEVLGGSFEKLIHSKAALYNINATDYLVKKLGITDNNRMSFLGGLSSYDLYKDENIEALIRYDSKKDVDNFLREAHHFISMGKLKPALENLENALNLDPSSGDTYAYLGWLYSENHDHKRAMDMFGKAYERDIFDKSTSMSLYVDAINRYGQHLFRRKDYQNAIVCFKKALSYDKEHKSSILHLEMATNRLNEKKFGQSTSRPMDFRK